MGHDIYALEEKAYLRRSAFSSEKDKKRIYELLRQLEHYNSASGDGSYIWVSKDEIKDAFACLLEEDESDITEFLISCLEIAIKQGGATIHFG